MQCIWSVECMWSVGTLFGCINALDFCLRLCLQAHYQSAHMSG